MSGRFSNETNQTTTLMKNSTGRIKKTRIIKSIGVVNRMNTGEKKKQHQQRNERVQRTQKQ